MSRMSDDEIRNGRVYNGFDYELQVWVVNGVIQPVGLGKALAGQSIYAVEGAESVGESSFEGRQSMEDEAR